MDPPAAALRLSNEPESAGGRTFPGTPAACAPKPHATAAANVSVDSLVPGHQPNSLGVADCPTARGPLRHLLTSY